MNVAEHVERVARKTPKHPAIRFEGKTLSYEVLNANANALAGARGKKGVRRGDRVALYMPNIPAFALAYLAVEKVGAIAVSINSIFKSEETRYILDDSGAKVVFTVAELLPNVPRAECRSVRHVVLCEGSVPGAQSLDDWLFLGSARFRAENMGADEPRGLRQRSA